MVSRKSGKKASKKGKEKSPSKDVSEKGVEENCSKSSLEREFQTPMMQQYIEIKRAHKDCIIFFRLGDFYEMFLEDAQIGAKVLDITLTGRDRGKDGRVPMAGVPYHAVDSYLPRLVKAGHKVAICEQVGDPESGGLMKREVVRIVTPGTLLNESSLEKKENNYIFSFLVTGKHIGVALADLSTGDFKSAEFKDTSLEQILTDEIFRFMPSECIVTLDDYNNPKILKVLKKNPNLNIYFYEDASFYIDNAENTLLEHFEVKDLSGFGLKEKTAAQKASALLLGYLYSTQKGKVSHISKISLLQRKDHVSLDQSTVINLEIFKTLRDGSKKGSLVGFLDQMQTSMGGRLLRSWLRSPLMETKTLEERYDLIDYYLQNLDSYEKLREMLCEIADIERILSRVSVGIGNPIDLVSLKSSVNMALNVREVVESALPPLTKAHKKLVADISPKLQDLVDYIEKRLIAEPPLDPKNGGFIKEGVDSRLDDLRKKILGSRDFVENLEEQQREETGIASLKVKSNKVYGYYIEVTKTNLDQVPDHYVRKQTLVNSERFITPELKRHEALILKAEEKIKDLEYELFLEIVEEVLSYNAFLQQASQAIATLDCLLNFTKFALEKDFHRPNLTSSGEIKINQGRHPVVEDLLPLGEFNPNDTVLNQKDHQLLILTGPNMSGKSVYIRQVAVIMLLAQIGCFVPAASAEITPVDRIFVRSGASDMISSGISTFMLEMIEAAYILNNATSNSLIIMDEIGRGTSTYDGISLAWSIASYLVTQKDLKPKTLFATHYHELCDLEKKFPDSIKNFQVLVQEDAEGEPIFLHKVTEGPAGHSCGIAVARLAGVPEEVTKKAEEVLKRLEGRGV
ncbi:DNA mismatch repair protein MutS [candidate division WWE3 bacterium]|nr:DNA mismatch repair protein MutS [candidate division WWE3 bacterium]